jgi:hypothetical protein
MAIDTKGLVAEIAKEIEKWKTVYATVTGTDYDTGRTTGTALLGLPLITGSKLAKRGVAKKTGKRGRPAGKKSTAKKSGSKRGRPAGKKSAAKKGTGKRRGRPPKAQTADGNGNPPGVSSAKGTEGA